MDVQGSQFHLLNGREDWGRCVDDATRLPLMLAWPDSETPALSAVHSSLAYDKNLGALRLTNDLALFRKAGNVALIDPAVRRGAGRDSYGNWYWIDQDQACIRWRPVDDDVSSTWWSAHQLTFSCAGSDAAEFVSCQEPPPAELTLAGLAVTTRHFLAAGYVAAGEQGLLVFDLHAGGTPARLLWPAPFAPFDLSDTADGGLLVLDRQNATYFRLDEHFRLRGQLTATEGPFRPVAGGPPERIVGPAIPTAASLYAGSPLGSVDAISIEPGPEPDTALVLDYDAARGYSMLHLFDATGQRWSTSLADAIEYIDPHDPTNARQLYSLLGLDFCYLTAPPATGPLPPPMLYIADARGKQVLAFNVDPASGALEPRPEFLPLRRWEAKALVRSGTGAWYDFADRWVPLEVLTECRFESPGVLSTPTDFATGVPGQPFDSQLPGCVWHRLLLDAQIPAGTSITVAARAADDPDLLVQSPWLPQPAPYLRTDRGELPWYDPWADLRAQGPLPDGSGTFELAFQQVTGRYLQLQLSLQSGGRSSPAVRSLRAWYPRFSYAEHYLPALYREDAAPRGFLDRFLANFEGFFTVTEERIEHSSLLLDARTVPAENLAWLACWFGLVLDPQWNQAQQRFLIRNADRFYRCRGTMTGLIAAMRVYLNADTDNSVFDCICPDGTGLRIVEQFRTRDGGGALYGDPAAPPGSGSEADRVASTAHRFDVLVPAGITAEALAMVSQIVSANKPAHTAFTVRGYFDLFIVGQARLGIDTQLGTGISFSPLVTGQAYLSDGYLGFPYPFDIPDRIVIDRDRVGGLPPL
jgi:phage tail-like protein